MYRVMIVDDYEIMRRQLKRLSLWKDQKDFEIVDEAADGQEALDKLRKSSVDLLITDIRMPGMGGLELLEKSYEENLVKYTVFLSDYTEFTLAKDAMKFKLFDYLVKPVQEKELGELLVKIKNELIEQEKKTKVKRDFAIETEGSLTLSPHFLETLPENLARSFCQGQKDVSLHFVHRLFMDSLKYHEEDYPSAHMTMENLLIETVKKIKEKASWLEDFLVFPSFLGLESHPQKRYQEKEVQFVYFIKEGIDLIQRLLLCQNEGLIHQACLYAVGHVDGDLKLGPLAEDLFVTKNHLSNLFKRETGMTLGQYITGVKMARASILLQSNVLRTYEIALSLGYKDPEYFSKVFKKHTGKTPTEYQWGNS